MVPLIPDSAPFNVEQRAWLNGFFAGLLGVGQPGGAAPLAVAPVLPPIEEEPTPWHDPALSLDERMGLAEGKPLKSRLMAAMAQLDCGSCGYLCKSYAEAIADGTESKLTLCSPGGKETSKRLKALLAEGKPAASANGNGNGHRTPAPTKPADPAPKAATVVSNRNLNGPESDKETRHVELDLSEAGLHYEPGDALGVQPTNDPGLVEAVLATLGASGDAQARDALTAQHCLADATDELLALLAEHADPADLPTLRAYMADGIPDGYDVLDVLRAAPSARPLPAVFLGSLSTLRPRLYSISSSPKAHPGKVHITVGKVVTEAHGRPRKGVASTLFAERARLGDTVRVFIKPAHDFRLPPDPATPIIMVGPGTGIAPFRGFLQERGHQQGAGPAWLFFGDRKRAHEFLYEDELQGFLDRGTLSRLDLAFSRDQAEKVYVQDRMREHAAELARWIGNDGAWFYVCGDAKRMARDVDRALREVLDAYGVAGGVERLAKEGRYRRDVY
jgi:sulfite reductase (NADPH) flavoprotein alpha-component